MNDSNENNALFQYAGCIVPLAAVTGAFVILVAIAHLLGDIIIGSQLEKLPRLLSKTELANNTEFP